MKKLLCLTLILALLPLTVWAADEPLYTATAKIGGPIYAEMDKESARVGRLGYDSSVNVFAIYAEWVLVGSAKAEGYVPRTYLYAGNFDMTLQGVVFSLSNIAIMYNSHCVNLNRSSNYGRLSDPAITAGIGAMRATLNRNTKFELIRELETYIAQSCYKLPLYCQDVLSVARTDRFSGWQAENGATAFNPESLKNLRWEKGE